MGKKKVRKSKGFKKAKADSDALIKYNQSNYLEDYIVIGKFCNLPPNKKDWIEVRRYELMETANRYERKIGEYLINKGIKFIHQAPFVINGKIYFLDFFIPSKRLAIEVDGSYHQSMRQSEYDLLRDYNFRSIGIKTMRIDNNEALSPNQIDIRLAIEDKRKAAVYFNQNLNYEK